MSILCPLTWRHNLHSLAWTTPVSNILSSFQRCSSHWSFTEVEIANSVDRDEASHREPPHLKLHCLHCLWILNIILLGWIFFLFCRVRNICRMLFRRLMVYIIFDHFSCRPSRHSHDVEMTTCNDVASTSVRRRFDGMCLLGICNSSAPSGHSLCLFCSVDFMCSICKCTWISLFWSSYPGLF